MDRQAQDAIIRELVRQSLQATSVYGRQSPQRMTAVPSLWPETRSPAAVAHPSDQALIEMELHRGPMPLGGGIFLDDQDRARGMRHEQFLHGDLWRKPRR